jgi:L-lactate dehydrogenase
VIRRNSKINDLKPKISIIGCGNVGMRYAYALIILGVTRKIILVDINREKLEGEVMDLNHTAPFISPAEISAGDYADIENSDLVVITAGKKQTINQTRLDLIKDNVEIYREIIPKITKYAKSSIYLIVSNPVDILTYAAYKFSKRNASEVIGSGTMLDTARFRYLLSKYCKVDSRNVHGYIIGEHGDSEVPIWSSTLIGGVLFDDYCEICKNKSICNKSIKLDKIYNEVRESAYKIIEKKGETSYGIGLSLVRISQAILNDENSILPVSCYLNDYYGINDVYISVPAIINKTGVREIIKLKFNDEEIQKLKSSAQTLKNVLNSITF